MSTPNMVPSENIREEFSQKKEHFIWPNRMVSYQTAKIKCCHSHTQPEFAPLLNGNKFLYDKYNQNLLRQK